MCVCVCVYEILILTYIYTCTHIIDKESKMSICFLPSPLLVGFW